MASYEDLRKEIFDEINKLRTNPGEFANRLKDTLVFYRENNTRMRPGAVPVMTREGVAAVLETVQALKAIKPMTVLQLSEGMSKSAQSHCNDTGPLGIVGHIGSKESTLQDRLESFGR